MCTKLTKMGKNCTNINKLTERLEFLVVEESITDEFERSWSLHERGEVAGDPPRPPSGPSDDTPSTVPERPRNIEPQNDDDDGLPEKPSPAPKRAKTTVDVSISEAMNVKQLARLC